MSNDSKEFKEEALIQIKLCLCRNAQTNLSSDEIQKITTETQLSSIFDTQDKIVNFIEDLQDYTGLLLLDHTCEEERDEMMEDYVFVGDLIHQMRFYVFEDDEDEVEKGEKGENINIAYQINTKSFKNYVKIVSPEDQISEDYKTVNYWPLFFSFVDLSNRCNNLMCVFWNYKYADGEITDTEEILEETLEIVEAIHKSLGIINIDSFVKSNKVPNQIQLLFSYPKAVDYLDKLDGCAEVLCMISNGLIQQTQNEAQDKKQGERQENIEIITSMFHALSVCAFILNCCGVDFIEEMKEIA